MWTGGKWRVALQPCALACRAGNCMHALIHPSQLLACRATQSVKFPWLQPYGCMQQRTTAAGSHACSDSIKPAVGLQGPCGWSSACAHSIVMVTCPSHALLQPWYVPAPCIATAMLRAWTMHCYSLSCSDAIKPSGLACRFAHLKLLVLGPWLCMGSCLV